MCLPTQREKLGSRLKSDSIGSRISADSVVIFGGTEEKEKESKSSGDYFGCNWNLVPYNGMKYFLHWPSVLSQEFPYDHNSLEVFCESDGQIGKYGHKGILHRHMSSANIPAIIEDIDGKPEN